MIVGSGRWVERTGTITTEPILRALTSLFMVSTSMVPLNQLSVMPHWKLGWYLRSYPRSRSANFTSVPTTKRSEGAIGMDTSSFCACLCGCSVVFVSHGLVYYGTSFWVYWDSDDSEIWGVLRYLGYSEFQLFPYVLGGHVRVATADVQMEHTKQVHVHFYPLSNIRTAVLRIQTAYISTWLCSCTNHADADCVGPGGTVTRLHLWSRLHWTNWAARRDADIGAFFS